MSPDRDGVALVPLLEATPLPVSRRVSPFGPYLSIRVWSSSSRLGSPSHQTRKLIELGLRPMAVPEVLSRPSTREDQNSAPGLPAQISPATPRPLSSPEAVRHRVLPVRASASQALGCEELSETPYTSSPGRAGTKSPTCRASPWPYPVVHMPRPSSSTAMAPNMISSRPSPSASAMDREWNPWPS